MKKHIITTILALSLFACSKTSDTLFVKSVKNFHTQRIEKLKQPDSWLSLIGLFWLEDGENSFGTDKSNKIVFPEKLNFTNLGVFTLTDSIVTVSININGKVYLGDSLITSAIMESDLTENPTILHASSLSWYLIKRGDKYGIRLKDAEAQLLTSFDDVEMFEIDSTYRVKAKFVEYENPKEVITPTAIGTFEKDVVYGKLEFVVDGKLFSLEPSVNENGYFIVFGDVSNGNETYGAGRFLYVEKPKSSEQLFIDFNKSYNPPCIFTKYATCPLPRVENYLNIKIIAGEKNFHSVFH